MILLDANPNVTEVEPETVEVFVVENPAWVSKMVLNHAHEVLETHQIELDELCVGDVAEITVTKEKMDRKEYDALKEWDG